MKNYIFFIVIIFILCTSCNIFKPELVYDRLYVYDYIPFKEDTKTVMLPETSTLRLRNNLPRLDGATALYPLYAAFVQEVYPKGDYWYGQGSLVVVSTTPRAYENLINGEADIIFCAKPSNEQIEMAEEKGIEFYMTPIGRDAFVFFVNKKNKVSNLTTEQKRKI
jgi:phosphate transport system substrate-binding protein